MRSALAFLPLVFAVTAGAQPAVTVLPHPALEAGSATVLEVKGAEGVERVEVPLREHVWEVPAAGPGPWTVRCTDPKLWCHDLMLTAEPGEPRPFPIFRRGRVSGSLPARLGGRAIERVVVQGWIEYSKEDPPMLFVLDLPVEGGSFAGELPAGQVDLRIAVPGAAPLYRWDLRPDDEGLFDLGRLSPIAGGSLSGFLAAPGDAGTAGIEVALEPLFAAATPRLERQLQRTEHVTRADSSGFFQLSGLEPGRYRLTAAGGGLRGEVEAVEVEADEEVHLRRIDLHGTLTLRARVLPPLPPGGGRWTVVLRDGEGEPREGVASPAGEVTWHGVHAGEHQIAVVSPGGDQVLEEPVALAEDRTVELHADLVEASGEVRMGGEPIVARVVVETGGGDATTLESGVDGALAGWVPRPRRRFLRLRVVAPHEGLDRTLELTGEAVEIEDDRLRLDLDLSRARVHGRVIDELGRPLPDVWVHAADAWLPAAEDHTDGAGRFDLHGLDPSAYWLTARSGRLGTADPVRVEVEDVDAEVEVLLVVRPTRPISGSLVSAEGTPVVGAQVSVDSVGGAFNDFVTTDADGTFEARIAAGTTLVSSTVLAPSRWLWAGCQSLVGDSLQLRLPPGPSGDLRLAIGWDESLPPAAGSLVLVSEWGGVVTADLRRMWSGGRAHETVVAPGSMVESVPAVAPGTWSAAMVDVPGWQAIAEGCVARTDTDLRWTSVLPTAEAVLEVDLSGDQRRRLEAR